MEIKKRYLQKYLHDIAIDQIAEEYQQKGYLISKKEKLGKYESDLIARKENETVVIEVKSGKMTQDRKQVITELGNYVRKQGNFKFLIVIATPPKEKKLEIEEIEDLLTKILIEDFPSELDELSTHTRLEEVTDIDIDEIYIDGKNIFVKGDGVVNVELQFGSDSDQNSGEGSKNHDSFPFDFQVTLEYDAVNKLRIAEVDSLAIDVSAYDDNKQKNN